MSRVTTPRGALEDLNRPVRRAVARVTVYPAWAFFLAVTVPFLLGVEVSLALQYVPLVASAVLFGMPHGAVDHLVPRRLAPVSTRRSVAAVVALYVALGGAYLLWWFLAPVSAAVFFVLLTWAHWGQGDVYLLGAVADGPLRYPRSVPHRLSTLLIRGAMPMAVPLVSGTDQYRQVVETFVTPFGGSVESIAWVFEPATTAAVGAALAVLTLLTLARGAVVRRDAVTGDVPVLARVGPVAVVADRGVRIDAAELVVLWVFFWTVPPVLAVGVYFCLWHALRHVARLVAADDPGARALGEGRYTAAFARFGRQAAPLTAVALALLGGLYVLVPTPPGVLGELVGLYLVLIAVLTLPHVVVVAWMDREQGVWSGSRGA